MKKLLDAFNFKLPAWQLGLYKSYRYKVLKGGRGSGKSFAIADALLRISFKKKCLILCCREYQASMKDSVISLLEIRAETIGLSKYFIFKETEIINKITGSRFFFVGLSRNIESIKSIPNITHAWVEEASTISLRSWDLLRNTVREDGSEIFLSFNPEKDTDAVYQEFCTEKIPENTFLQHVNYYENLYFPDTLRAEMERDKAKDYGRFRHIWLGEILKNSDSQVFKTPQHWVVDKFEDDAAAFKYFGLDFGFSQDPTAATRMYIKDNKLFITHEAVRLGLEIDDTAKYIEDRLPNIRQYCIYADNARPESISYIKRQGYSIRATSKGKGSVEDGIEYMKSFDKIIVHERCVHTIDEFTKYSYKVDARSGIISNILVDDNNHCIDSIRYALESCMKNKSINYGNWID